MNFGVGKVHQISPFVFNLNKLSSERLSRVIKSSGVKTRYGLTWNSTARMGHGQIS